jgi:DNA-binding MurR/RpiR family transcriptional regulator
MRPDISFVPTSWMTFAEDMIDISNKDAVLAIGFRRRSRIFRALLEHSARGGAQIVLITDLSASNTAKIAHAVLRCHSRPSYLFDSYAAAISVLNYLVSAVALKAESKVRPRLRRIEDLHEQLDAFTIPQPRSRRRSGKASEPS